MNGFGNFGSNKPANVRHVTKKLRKRPAPRVRVAGVQRNVFQLVIRFYKIKLHYRAITIRSPPSKSAPLHFRENFWKRNAHPWEFRSQNFRNETRPPGTPDWAPQAKILDFTPYFKAKKYRKSSFWKMKRAPLNSRDFRKMKRAPLEIQILRNLNETRTPKFWQNRLLRGGF